MSWKLILCRNTFSHRREVESCSGANCSCIRRRERGQVMQQPLLETFTGFPPSWSSERLETSWFKHKQTDDETECSRFGPLTILIDGKKPFRTFEVTLKQQNGTTSTQIQLLSTLHHTEGPNNLWLLCECICCVNWKQGKQNKCFLHILTAWGLYKASDVRCDWGRPFFLFKHTQSEYFLPSLQHRYLFILGTLTGNLF